MDDQMILVGESTDGGFKHFRARLSEAQTCWIEEQIDRVRRGNIRASKLEEMIATRSFDRSVPFLRETMTTSDFPLMLIANVADRALLAGYAETPATWTQYCYQKTNSDLKDANLFAIDGGEGVLDQVNELAPYPEASVSETKYTIRVFKYGRIFRFSLELYLNDGLNAFNSTPMRMGKAARRTEDYLVTRTYATDAAIAAFFTTGNKNKIVTGNGARTDNPVFSLDGILSGLQVLANQLDSDGQPINIQGAKVVYPSNLEGTAMQLRKTMETRSSIRGGDANNLLITGNQLEGVVELVPNHQLAVVGGTNKATGWWIFANPNNGRPAIAAARLMGHEAPDLYVKSSNSLQIGGGLVDPMQGSFEDDSTSFKVRTFFGTTRVDPKVVVYSNGTAA